MSKSSSSYQPYDSGVLGSSGQWYANDHDLHHLSNHVIGASGQHYSSHHLPLDKSTDSGMKALVSDVLSDTNPNINGSIDSSIDNSGIFGVKLSTDTGFRQLMDDTLSISSPTDRTEQKSQPSIQGAPQLQNTTTVDDINRIRRESSLFVGTWYNTAQILPQNNEVTTESGFKMEFRVDFQNDNHILMRISVIYGQCLSKWEQCTLLNDHVLTCAYDDFHAVYVLVLEPTLHITQTNVSDGIVSQWYQSEKQTQYASPTIASETKPLLEPAIPELQHGEFPNRDPNNIDLRIKIPGSGSTPNSDSKVEIEYTGQFADGTQFIKHREELQLGVGENILGLEQACLRMREGDWADLWIPYKLAFGEGGAGSLVPPKSDLTFFVTLHRIVKQ